ncbi:MAG TPA: cysteine desulfurase [Steroidobacteraceae bacterium]|jgi:cysteine desulfurase/selenocysteine lyase|nr:cysteine desulfurase [Steroidobacteraceae bacterium]
MSAEVRAEIVRADGHQGDQTVVSAQPAGLPLSALEVERLRADFPILSRQINGHPLVYLDSAASAQCPTPVLAAMEQYVTTMHANVHRGVHSLSQWATDAYEQARERVSRFINARSTREIVFVRGTTEAINLVANSFGRSALRPGDEVLITHLEHHANIVPWQLVCAATGARLRAVPVLPDGSLDMVAFRELLGERTRLVALAHVSNALGTVLPVREIVQLAHAQGVPVLLDGAQAIAHAPVDVQALDCDFYAFSGHKIYGPTGIGVLYGREALLRQMPPWQGGGDMILTVSIEHTTYNELPWKFEAGTPPIAAAIGLAAALDYVEAIGRERIAAHEQMLLRLATAQLAALPYVRLVGTAPVKAAVLSFTMEGVHPHDIGTILDSEGIAIRTGHHCAMPIMERFGLAATARASFALYNRAEEIARLVDALRKVRELFG